MEQSYIWLPDGSLCASALLESRHARMSNDGGPSKVSIDSRGPTERDLGRILYSARTRRLAGVAQIVSPTLLNTSIHNRLTHSLRVSQLSREIANDILRAAKDAEKIDQGAAIQKIIRSGGLDVSACAAAGLAHDVGHSPYGHAAGRILDRWLQEKGGDGFEGNAQTIRTLSQLDSRPESEGGQDLTAVTLCALMKYPHKRLPDTSKFSIYLDNSGVLEFARKALPEEDHLGALRDSKRMSLEAAVMTLADDITYATHDLEDFIIASVLKLPTVIRMLKSASGTLTNFALEDLEKEHHPNALVNEAVRLAKIGGESLSVENYVLAIRDAREYFRRLAGPPGNEGGASVEEYREYVVSIFSEIIGNTVRSISILDEPYWPGGPLVMPDARQWLLVQVLKTISERQIIGSSLVAIQDRAQVAIIEDLVKQLLKWVINIQYPAELPAELRRLYMTYLPKDEPVDDAMPARRAIVDFVCSLTDSQCDDLRRKLVGLSLPSVLTDY